MVDEKSKLIKILQEDLSTTEKKYYESIKEKESLKALLNIKTNLNSKQDAFQSIVHEESSLDISFNKSICDDKKYFNKITINNNNNINNNNHFNILSNYKNSANGINSRNKTRLRPFFDIDKLNDLEENKMNMTIDINNKPSNFAMFNNNLTSKNNKVIIFFIFIKIKLKFLIYFYFLFG